jgi:hypothetical protein
MFRSKALLAGGAALLLAAAALVGYGMYASHQKRVDEQHLTALVGETTALLVQALKAPTKEGVGAIDAGLERLKTSKSTAFAGAVELYVVSAREIARRRLDTERLLGAAAASRQALIAHMNRSARRDSGWIKEALELKSRVERDHAELSRSLKALDELLYGLVDVQKQLAPFVDASLMIPDTQRDLARAVVQAEMKRAETELQKVRNITP